MAMRIVSVCLTDLPKDKITTGKTNGKKYISLVVEDKKETDQWGNNVSVSISQTKEERERKDKKVYVGNGKSFDGASPKSALQGSNDDSGLPF